MCVENKRSDAPEDGCTSSFFNSGGGGTWSWISTRWRRGGDDARSRFWRQLIGVIDTHLNDWGYFKGFLWLLLKVVMERDWLGCDDVDECLDKLVLCLTRHNSGNRLQFTCKPQTRYAKSACPRPARRTPTLLHLFRLPLIPTWAGFRYHGCEYNLKRSPTISIVLIWKTPPSPVSLDSALTVVCCAW
jgi:hypothetical protein